MPGETRIYWPAVTLEAIARGELPRVLAEMRVGKYRCSLRRGACGWWAPTYFPMPAPPPLHTHQDARASVLAAWRAREAARLGRINRAVRDSMVRVHWLSLDASCGRTLLLDEAGGDLEWRTMDGGNRGASLIELGMWRWDLAFTASAYRIARIIGLDPIPRVPSTPRPRPTPEQKAPPA